MAEIITAAMTEMMMQNAKTHIVWWVNGNIYANSIRQKNWCRIVHKHTENVIFAHGIAIDIVGPLVRSSGNFTAKLGVNNNNLFCRTSGTMYEVRSILYNNILWNGNNNNKWSACMSLCHFQRENEQTPCKRARVAHTQRVRVGVCILFWWSLLHFYDVVISFLLFFLVFAHFFPHDTLVSLYIVAACAAQRAHSQHKTCIP